MRLAIRIARAPDLRRCACRRNDRTGRIESHTMTTPRGYLQSITSTFMRLARNGDVDGFRTYVRSEAFLAAFSRLDPERRSSAMRTYVKAETLCEAKARLPKPK